jgi:hypothetical protein
MALSTLLELEKTLINPVISFSDDEDDLTKDDEDDFGDDEDDEDLDGFEIEGDDTEPEETA